MSNLTAGYTWALCGPRYDYTACALFSWVTSDAIARITTYAENEAVPVGEDLYVGSPFITDLNAFPETFRRASIQSYVPRGWFSSRNWSFFRLIGDDGVLPVNGDDMFVLAEGAHLLFFADYLISLGAGEFDRADFDHAVWTGMEQMDASWNYITSPPGGSHATDADGGFQYNYEHTDGFITGWSQEYPHPEDPNVRRFPILGAGPSHLGETTSFKTSDQVLAALRNHFNVHDR